ncbi:MAG: FTR1 family protein [Polyangiales bacterium]
MSPRTRFCAHIGCGFALLLFCTQISASPDRGQSLRQIAGVLEYIAGDYRQAVSADGNVLEASEYDEQRSLAAEAGALAAQAGLPETDALRVRLSALQRALGDKRPPDEVARACRDTRELLVQRYAVALSPESTPSRSEAAAAYVQQGCATCHGADGSANTEAASKLTPHPANFLDPARVASVSPHRAFHAISFGLQGTAMQAFPQLSDAQRWSLAFYVLSLRHAHADLDAGKATFERSGAELPTSAAGLAGQTDEDLSAALSGLGSLERAQALAYLRARAPFEANAGAAGTRLSLARKLLHAGLAAYRAGDAAGARRDLVAAYLDGFEPHEAALSARDPKRVREIEHAMLTLRQAAAERAPVERVEKLGRDVETLLSAAEGGSGAGAAFVGALTISLREGLEIALLIGALLGIVRKRGTPELARYVHAGWMLAAACGLLTFWAVGELLSGMQRELAEGIATLVAAVVLFGVTHWLLGQLGSKRFMGFLARSLDKAIAGRGAALGILGLSFLAVYREAFEIVLFFKALLLEAGDEPGRVWLGTGIGLSALVLVTFTLRSVGQRLQPRPFMLASSVLLGLIVVAMVGNGVHSLQEAAVLAVTEVRAPELPWLGVHASAQSLGAQALVLLLLLGSALLPLMTRGGTRSPSPAK